MGKIANPKTEVPKGIAMNDKDYLDAILTCLKEMVKNYAIALTEASNEHLYKVYLNMWNTYSQLQRETYEVLFENGWYSLEEAPSSKVEEKAKMLRQELDDLSE